MDKRTLLLLSVVVVLAILLWLKRRDPEDRWIVAVMMLFPGAPLAVDGVDWLIPIVSQLYYKL